MEKKNILNIGFGNMIVASRIVAVLVPGSSPMRRLKEAAGKAGRLAIATKGRKCRSVLLLDSGHMILSAIQSGTLCQRLEKVSCDESDGENNVIITSRIVAILVPGSSPMRRLKEEAGKAGKLVDTTKGRKFRSLLLLDSGHLVLSPVHADTMKKRFDQVSREIAESVK